MSAGLEPLLQQLADGQPRSGPELAGVLGVSRQAVWKQIGELRRLGLEIATVRGRGYRLATPWRALDLARIRSAMADPNLPVERRFLVDSSNLALAAALDRRPPPAAMLAEAQTAGRGRRDRGWHSPPGGVYLSLAWNFESALPRLAALSLVVGLASAEALQGLGVHEIKVKWPNDLVLGGYKLGGCLIDLQGTADGPCRAIVGVGINLSLPDSSPIDQPWTDLHRAGFSIDRSRLAADLINGLVEAAKCFDRFGFDRFADRWQALDALAGRSVDIDDPRGPTLAGRALGVDQQGRLLLETAAGRQAISCGQARVRQR